MGKLFPLKGTALASTVFYIEPCSRTAGNVVGGKGGGRGKLLSLFPRKEISQVMEQEVEAPAGWEKTKKRAKNRVHCLI